MSGKAFDAQRRAEVAQLTGSCYKFNRTRRFGKDSSSGKTAYPSRIHSNEKAARVSEK